MESKLEFHAISVDALTQPAPLAGLQWWRGKLAAHGSVRRADVEPLLEIPRLLAHAALLAREQTGWQMRVVGSEIDRQTGRKLAGQTLAVALPRASASLIPLLDEATSLRLPRAASGTVHRVEAGEAMSWQAVMLPLEHEFPRILAIAGWTIELLDEPFEITPAET